MAGDARHGHGAAAPRLPEIEIEGVVLNIFGPRVVLDGSQGLRFHEREAWGSPGVPARTDRLFGPAREMLCYCLRDGRLLSYAEDPHPSRVREVLACAICQSAGAFIRSEGERCQCRETDTGQRLNFFTGT